VRADGSAENILLKLNGGIDLNGAGSDPAKRDNPPALANDIFLGYEQPAFVQRIQPEKFAAVDTTRNKFGSAGAETYAKVIGSSGFTITNGPAGSNNYDNLGGDAASFLYHNPVAGVGGSPGGGWPGGDPPSNTPRTPTPSRSGPNPMAWDQASKCSATTPPMDPIRKVPEAAARAARRRLK
jgi:hypothetical protein